MFVSIEIQKCSSKSWEEALSVNIEAIEDAIKTCKGSSLNGLTDTLSIIDGIKRELFKKGIYK